MGENDTLVAPIYATCSARSCSLRGAGLAEAVREGMAAAMLALESTAAVPAFTPAEFGAALELVPAAEQVA